MDNWDFDCPQFIDFAAALDSPSNEVFYDVSYDVPTSVSESDDVLPKMATPKMKPNDPLKNYPFIKFSTDDEKLAKLSKIHSRLSKSDGCINQIIKPPKTPGGKDNYREDKKKRRTSFPMNNIRRKRVYPTTPKCLKRTVNSKLKNTKTSEELELQKIAELQDTLHKHLRLNKINLKRLKMNKAPFTLERLPKKSESKPPVIKNALMASSKPAAASNRKLPYQNNVVCGTTSVSKGLLERFQNKEKPSEISKKKAPFNVLRDHNAQKKDTEKTLKKLPLFQRDNVHGGLKFFPHQEETMQCPFSFDASYASSQNASLRVTNLSKLKTPLSKSKNIPYILENKENLK